MDITNMNVPLVLNKDHSLENWKEKKRSEVLQMFNELVFGVTPDTSSANISFDMIDYDENAMEGKAVKKIISIRLDAPRGFFSFPFTIFIPKELGKKAPVFLLLCNRYESNIDSSREIKSDFWPAEYIISRGYAAATFNVQDIDTDKDDAFKNGIHKYYEDVEQRSSDSWATIAAWAFGASRVMDYLETDELIDKDKVAVIGHSRGGKTALWCGSQDERFYYTISNNSGCTGAALSRGKKGESIKQINSAFPYWFCENYKQFNDREEDLPFDQHMLLSLIAPRLLYVASASEDFWADPESEFLSCVLASEVYELYGIKGLQTNEMPQPDHPLQEGRIGYHIRTGGHNLTLYDWKCYIDFADRHISGF